MGFFKRIIDNAILGSPAERELAQMRDYMRQSAERNHPSPVSNYDSTMEHNLLQLAEGALFGSEPYAVAPSPIPSFNTAQAAIDEEVARRGDLSDQVRPLLIPVTQTGWIYQGLNVQGFNGLYLAPRVMVNGVEIQSAQDSRLYIGINRGDSLIPFSFNLDRQGGQYNDQTIIASPISRLWVYVSKAALDPSVTPYMILLLLRDVQLAGLNLFGGPQRVVSATPQLAGQANVEQVTGAGEVVAGGGSGGGSTPTTSGGGTGTSGGGGTFVGPTGGGGSGGGGTGRKL